MFRKLLATSLLALTLACAPSYGIFKGTTPNYRYTAAKTPLTTDINLTSINHAPYHSIQGRYTNHELYLLTLQRSQDLCQANVDMTRRPLRIEWGANCQHKEDISTQDISDALLELTKVKSKL